VADLTCPDLLLVSAHPVMLVCRSWNVKGWQVHHTELYLQTLGVSNFHIEDFLLFYSPVSFSPYPVVSQYGRKGERKS
jgi:hypothetical protein